MKLCVPIILLLGLVGTTSFSRCGKGSTGGSNPPPQDTTENPPAHTPQLAYIFKSGTEGYSCFRIPALISTPGGTLLAFAEARKNNCSDEDDINLVVKRSTDGGKTWGSLITVWDQGGNTCGNPVPVVEKESGKIFLLMTWNLGEDDIGEINNGTSEDTRRVFVTSSADDGFTWQTPKEITAAVKKPEWGWYATGPCHGLQISKGMHTGRLVIPCDYIEVGTKKGSSHVFYSDDKGATWQLGGIVASDKINESTVAELSDGKLMLNMRSSYGVRMVAISNDGGETWGAAKADPALVEPVCQGSLLNWENNGGHYLFFSNPASTKRENMTVKMSTDDGGTWKKSYQVYAGPSAYSDIVMLPGEKIGILYEAGKAKPYEGIAFMIVPVADFK